LRSSELQDFPCFAGDYFDLQFAVFSNGRIRLLAETVRLWQVSETRNHHAALVNQR
jgi:hypothetical protein